MITEQEVEAVIFSAIETLNAERSPDDAISKALDTILFGANSRIDSLSLVSLIVDVETSINADHGLAISLADDRALARAESPYASVGALKEYVLELARESGEG
jgi:acyl carrier protein